MSQVIPMPVDRADRAARVEARREIAAADPPTGVAGWDVDDWGRDASFVGVASFLTHLRWSTTVGGQERLPARGAAVVVINSRRFGLTPWFVALVLSGETGRPVRFVGRPDTAPAGAVARRLGGLLARPDEVASALRDGEMLVVGASGTMDPRAVGTVDHRLIGPAVERRVPVFPAAVAVAQLARRANIEIAPAVKPPRRRRGPLGELELADAVRIRIGQMLQEFGGTRTGTPLDWLSMRRRAEQRADQSLRSLSFDCGACGAVGTSTTPKRAGDQPTPVEPGMGAN